VKKRSLIIARDGVLPAASNAARDGRERAGLEGRDIPFGQLTAARRIISRVIDCYAAATHGARR
jgi:hypothetical protein